MHAPSWQQIIDLYYPAGSPLRDIYVTHCRQVAGKALQVLARLRGRGVAPLPQASQVEAASMLHDIGIVACDAPSIECHGSLPYICHGTEGARMLRALGVDEALCRVAERHTGSGLTAAEIVARGLPLPPADLLPVTWLERIVCYADKFYSKTSPGLEKPLERVRASIGRHGADALARFEALHALMGDDAQLSASSPCGRR